jgi:hypothetical protein
MSEVGSIALLWPSAGPLPVYPDQRTFLVFVCMSQRCQEAEVIGAFGHGVESLPTTARGTLRAVLQCNRHLYAPARQMSEISCQSHLEAAVSLNSSTLPHVLSVTAKTS